ncbi:regulatory protein GemA [Citrobacter koseri]|uniref:gp16 family protein n=1 Tax=Citrobacter koseri TaxID=545 RepID=UPI000CE67F40|nr:regulatory protein GemA [Citrobacter koseri]AVE67916.1 regulatory protein GemA [Citrobacter koseri]
MQRANLIKLIHVARRKLALDDETYRSVLSGVIPGKTSCRDMKVGELEAVLKVMECKGFKREKSLRPSQPKAAPIVTDKIRVIWKIMHRQGFITDGSDKSLNAFVRRITRLKNGGEGVASLEWLRGDQASTVLESLKRWHMRCMLERLPDIGVKPTYECVCKRFQQYN